MSKRGNLKDMKKAVLYKSIYTKMVEFLKFQRLHVVNPLNNLIDHLLRGDNQHDPISKGIPNSNKNYWGWFMALGLPHHGTVSKWFHRFISSDCLPWPSSDISDTTT